MTDHEIYGINKLIIGINDIAESCDDREKKIFFEGVRTGLEIWVDITQNASKRIALKNLFTNFAGSA